MKGNDVGERVDILERRVRILAVANIGFVIIAGLCGASAIRRDGEFDRISADALKVRHVLICDDPFSPAPKTYGLFGFNQDAVPTLKLVSTESQQDYVWLSAEEHKSHITVSNQRKNVASLGVTKDTAQISAIDSANSITIMARPGDAAIAAEDSKNRRRFAGGFDPALGGFIGTLDEKGGVIWKSGRP